MMNKLINSKTLLNQTNILFIAICCFFILVADYKIYDGFWTPLRAIAFSFESSEGFLSWTKGIVENSIHNDSIKAFPSILEYVLMKCSR